MILAGIDQSLSGTAISIFDTKENHLLYISSLKKEGKLRGVKRLIAIKEKVETVLEEHGVEHAFFEGYSYGSRGRLFDLGEIGGVLKVALHLKGFPFTVIPPTSLKKFVAKNGNAGKPMMLERCYRKYGVGSEVLKDDNMVDAYCLVRMGEKLLTYVEQFVDPFYEGEKEKFTKEDLTTLKNAWESNEEG